MASPLRPPLGCRLPPCPPNSAEQPESVRAKFVPALLRGVAAHHAGCLPGWKGLVERCFQKNLVKLVFATGENPLLCAPCL